MKKNRHANGKGKSKPSKKPHKRHKSHRAAQHSMSPHDWSALITSAHTPPPARPPRPWPDSVPAVIITPCTPTAGEEVLLVKPELIYTTPKVSPLDLTIVALNSAQYSGSSPHPEYRRAISSNAQKPGSDPPQKENISELPVAYVGSFPPRRKTAPNLELSGMSVCLSQPQDGVLFKSATLNSSDVVQNIPPWTDFETFPHPDYIAASMSYTTSTPPRKSLASASAQPRGLPAVISLPHPMLCLPDEQMDLLPYPEVFDIDVYYGSPSGRRSSASTSTAEISTTGTSTAETSTAEPSSSSSSDVHYPLRERNPFAPAGTPKYLSSSPCTNTSPSDSDDMPIASMRRAPQPQTPTGGSESEVARLWEYHQHRAFADSPGQGSSESTSGSGESAAFSTPTPNPRSASFRVPALRPRPSLPLMTAKGRGVALGKGKGKGKVALTRAATLSRESSLGKAAGVPVFIPAPVSMKQRAPSSASAFTFAPASPARVQVQLPSTVHPPPPIVIVSHHRFGSLSQDESQPEPEPASDVSREVLQARLQETCEHFSRSVSEDDSTSTEEIYLPGRF